eukprot:2405054-Prymnesium_polylepis.2
MILYIKWASRVTHKTPQKSKGALCAALCAPGATRSLGQPRDSLASSADRVAKYADPPAGLSEVAAKDPFPHELSFFNVPAASAVMRAVFHDDIM